MLDFGPPPHVNFGQIVRSVIYKLPLTKTNSKFMTRNTRKFLKLCFIGDLITFCGRRKQILLIGQFYSKKIQRVNNIDWKWSPHPRKTKTNILFLFLFSLTIWETLGLNLGRGNRIASKCCRHNLSRWSIPPPLKT